MSSHRSVSTEAGYRRAAEILKALSHPTRLRIVALLTDGELCVSRMEELLGVPQPSVSQHLQRLRYAGLLRSERKGHQVCYRLADTAASEVLELVLRRSEGASGEPSSSASHRR